MSNPPSKKSTSYLNINETFITDEGSSLLEFRENIKAYSLNASSSRLAYEKKAKKEFSYSQYKSEKEIRQHKHFLNFGHVGSQIGGVRPLSSVAINEKTFLTGCWSGDATLWDIDSLHPISQLESGHGDNRVCSVSYLNTTMATGDSAGLIRLWMLTENDKSLPIGTLSGHQGRVYQLATFPHFQNNSFLCSASSDTTWRIWDCALEKCILLQEGHSKDVSSITVHPDGALVITGGFDANGVVWDVRIGRPIFTLKGHSDAVVGVSCSSNGILIATGSQDSTARIWDLRKLQSTHTLLAHTGPLTGLKFSKFPSSNKPWGLIEGSPLLLTTSQDSTAKLWAPCSDWSQVALFAGHSGKVMQGDISDDNQTVITVSYDRSIKLWKTNSEL